MVTSPPSFQALLRPIVETNRSLDSLLDVQWRLHTLEGSFADSHPELAELRHISAEALQRAVQQLRSERSALMRAFLQTLQHYVRDYDRWPDLDE